MPESDKVVFAKKELAGSRLRCLMFTSGSRDQVAARLTELIRPLATVDARIHKWMPRGFLSKWEAQLGRTDVFLTDSQREQLLGWWLVKRRGAQTPNWDIVSECQTSEGRPGLLLVEAKAHERELGADDTCKSGDPDNRKNIGEKLSKASEELEKLLPGWNLGSRPHYQLSNRFAWSWQLAKMGVPVILVYLGFLNANEMSKAGQSAFATHEAWVNRVLEYAGGTVPPEAWRSSTTAPEGASFRAILRSVQVDFDVHEG